MQFSSVPNGSGQVPSKYKYVTEPGDVFQGSTAKAAPHVPAGSRTSSAAPAAGVSWCQQGRGGGVWKACGCSYLEDSSSTLCFTQSIREGCQMLDVLERLYAKMPRVDLSKKQPGLGPNKVRFACAKTTNHQRKCQKLCVWQCCDRHCSYVRQGVQQSFVFLC